MITAFFNEELGVLEVTYSGKVTLKEIQKHGQWIEKNDELPRDLLILYLVENAYYGFDFKDTLHLKEEMEEHLKPYRSWKEALVHTSPRETALSMLVELEHVFKEHDYQRKIFSTRKAALGWLLS